MESAQPLNLRDVGAEINRLLGKEVLPINRVFRCGKIDFFTHEQLKRPMTIINLRGGPDDKSLPVVSYVQFAISNDIEKYHTTEKQVRGWLNDIFKYLEDSSIKYPILFHCTSGKDRTGVVIAILLTILGIPHQTIVDEFLLSADVKKEDIEGALAPIEKNPAGFFKSVNLSKVKANVLGKS